MTNALSAWKLSADAYGMLPQIQMIAVRNAANSLFFINKPPFLLKTLHTAKQEASLLPQAERFCYFHFSRLDNKNEVFY